MQKAVRKVKASAADSANYALGLTKTAIYHSVIIAITLGLIANSSVFMYATFYYAFVPAPEHEGYVNPIFEPCSPREKSMLRCGFLNGTGLLSSSDAPVLMAGQAYTVTVMLEMPESPVNRKLGMFMNCLQLRTARSVEVVRESCRSSMLQYRSGLLRILETFVFAPALLTGHTSEKQWIRVEFFDDFYDDPMRPATRVDFQILSRFVEVYQVHYRIHANFAGVRYMMYRYPLSSALVGIAINFGFLSLLALVAWLKFFTGLLEAKGDFVDDEGNGQGSGGGDSSDSDGEKEMDEEGDGKRSLGSSRSSAGSSGELRRTTGGSTRSSRSSAASSSKASTSSIPPGSGNGNGSGGGRGSSRSSASSSSDYGLLDRGVEEIQEE